MSGYTLVLPFDTDDPELFVQYLLPVSAKRWGGFGRG